MDKGIQPSNTSSIIDHTKNFWENSKRVHTNTTSGATPYSPSSIDCFYMIRMTAAQKLTRYFRRFIHVRQMDFEFASWQMLYLLVNPQKVYRNFMYRKKN